jgi:hypothetical protein
LNFSFWCLQNCIFLKLNIKEKSNKRIQMQKFCPIFLFVFAAGRRRIGKRISSFTNSFFNRQNLTLLAEKNLR